MLGGTGRSGVEVAGPLKGFPSLSVFVRMEGVPGGIIGRVGGILIVGTSRSMPSFEVLEYRLGIRWNIVCS
jgi:hypothetical protein